MSEYVWVSAASMDLQLRMSAKSDMSQTNVEVAMEASRLNKNGKSVPAEMCPKKIWADIDADEYDKMPVDNMPDLFFVRSYWIVSEKAAEIMRQFDLGGGALYLVSEGVFRDDEVTRVPGNFYTWIYGNVKEAFEPDETPNKRPVAVGIPETPWNLPWKLADGDIAVSKAALSPPDVWLDPMLWHTFFLSRALGDALVAAGLQQAFHLYKARVV